MRRLLRYVAALLLASTIFMSAAPGASATTAEQPPVWRDPSPLILSAYSVIGEQPRYVEIYNSGDKPIDVTGWSLVLQWSLRNSAPIGNVAPEISPLALYAGVGGQTPYIQPGGYIVIGFNGAVPNALQQATLSGLSATSYVSQLSLQHSEYRPYTRNLTESQAVNDGTKRLNIGATGYTTTYGDINKDKVYQDEDYYYAPSGDFPLVPIEILANPKTCSPLDTSSDCLEYVKFYNNTDAAVNFADTRLRVGGSSIELSGDVASGKYVLFAVALPNTGGYISLEDKYGVHTYRNTVIEYPDASATTKKGVSWALFSAGWDWAIPTPGGTNTPLPPEEPGRGSVASLTLCRDDQYRNPLTNRCKLIATTTSSLQPCAANQHRSLETNRCRNNVTATSSSSLRPCASNQYRNPETNRCRLIASTASSLKPCSVGQERNPETNRCRNATGSSMPKADFPVEKIKQRANDTIGWLAFAGVGSMAAGYGVWEWRRELGGLPGKIVGLLKK